jgi:hypothetical protein
VVGPLLCGGGGSRGEGGQGGAERQRGVEDGGGRLTGIRDAVVASWRRNHRGGPSFFAHIPPLSLRDQHTQNTNRTSKFHEQG